VTGAADYKCRLERRIEAMKTTHFTYDTEAICTFDGTSRQPFLMENVEAFRNREKNDEGWGG
jgi:hypothetical protein